MIEIDLDTFEGFTPGSWILSDEGDGYFIIKDAKGNYLIVGDGCLHGKVADLRLAAAAPDLLALAKQQREEIRCLRSALEIAKEFIDEQSDVVDGDYGEPAPNDAMRCLADIGAAIQSLSERGRIPHDLRVSVHRLIDRVEVRPGSPPAFISSHQQNRGSPRCFREARMSSVLLIGNGQAITLTGPTVKYEPTPAAKFPDNSLVKVRRLKHLRHLPDAGAVVACVPAGVSPSEVWADYQGAPRPLMVQAPARTTTYLIAFEGDLTPHLIRERDLIATEGSANISLADDGRRG